MNESDTMTVYPRILLKFCTKCKWTLRATWYQSELFQTFSSEIGEITLQPSEAGVFQIWVFMNDEDKGTLIWDRVEEGGFPDSKVLKRRVRDVLYGEGEKSRDLGHVDRVRNDSGEEESGLLRQGKKCWVGNRKEEGDEGECLECEEQEKKS